MTEQPSDALPDEQKSSERFIQERDELRALLKAERERCRLLTEDNTRLKSVQTPQNEQIFCMLFEKMTEGFALGEPILDENGEAVDFRFIEVNRSFEKQSGLSRDVVGKPLKQALPRVKREWVEIYSEVALHGKTVRFENYNQDLDRHFDVCCYRPFQGHFAILFTDVTEYKKSEEKLQQTHGLLKGITEGTEEMIAAEDHKFRYLFFNDAYRREFKKLWGIDIEVGMSMVEALAPWPDEQQKARAMWARALNGETFQQTMNFGPSTAQTQIYNLRFNPILDASGQQIGAAHILRNISQEARMREELRESEEKFRTVFEQAAVGICRVNFSDARWIEFNDTFKNMLGYSRAELKKIPWPEITHPEDVDLDFIPFRKMAAGKLESYTVEKRFIHKEGHYVWSRLTLSLVRDAEGLPDYEIAIIEDINERKLAEQALRENEERLRIAVEGGDLGTWDLDLVNDAATRSLRHDEIWGYSELQPEWGYEIAMRQVIPEDRPTVEKALVRSEKTGLLSFEARVRWPDGSIHWVFLKGNVHFDDQGKSVRIVGVVADITERKQTEQALERVRDSYQQQLRLFRGITTSTPDHVFVFDPQGRFVYANRRLRELWGMEQSDVLGKTPLQLGYEQWQHDLHMREIAQVIETKRPIKGEVSFKNPLTGIFGVYEYIFTPVVGTGGEVESIAGISRDVTERVRHEEERERLIAEMEAANTELEGFTYSVSHDLRAPLRHMNSFSELLKKEAWPVLSEQSRSYLSIVMNASNRMSTMADELLRFSRMGSSALEETLVNINTIVSEIIDNYATDIHVRDIQWRISKLPRLLGDSVMLQLVFSNLIDNALKFTRNCAAAVIEIGCVLDDTECLLYIGDNGIGFDMRYYDKLFGLFQRLHTLEKIEGTGVGLANVARIVQRHGGRVWAEGKVDEGAVFYLAFPKEKMECDG